MKKKVDTGRMWLEITFPFIIPALPSSLFSKQCPLFICLPSLDLILVYHAMHLLFFYYALLSLPTKSGIRSNREDGNLKETSRRDSLSRRLTFQSLRDACVMHFLPWEWIDNEDAASKWRRCRQKEWRTQVNDWIKAWIKLETVNRFTSR